MEHKQGCREKQALPCMEADKTVLVIGLNHQKNDCRDDGDIGQHSCNVVAHTAGRSGGGRRGRGCDSARADCTRGSAIRDLSAANTAKSHGFLLESFGLRDAALHLARDRRQPNQRHVIKKLHVKQSRIEKNQGSSAWGAATSPSSGSLNITP